MFNIKNLSNMISNIVGSKPSIDILKETENFSIKDFYENSIDAEGAVILITPKQVIKTPLIYGYSHGAMVDTIYEKIIPGYENFSNKDTSPQPFNDDDNISPSTWEKTAMNLNHIVLKLVKFDDNSKIFGLNEGFVPNNINTFQYEELIKLNKEMIDSKIDISFYYPYNDFNEDLYKNLDFLVATMYDYIDDNITSDEINLKENNDYKIK